MQQQKVFFKVAGPVLSEANANPTEMNIARGLVAATEEFKRGCSQNGIDGEPWACPACTEGYLSAVRELILEVAVASAEIVTNNEADAEQAKYKATVISVDEAHRAPQFSNEGKAGESDGCPFCGSPAPDEIVLDQWGYFHCAEEECHARLNLNEGGRLKGYSSELPNSQEKGNLQTMR